MFLGYVRPLPLVFLLFVVLRIELRDLGMLDSAQGCATELHPSSVGEQS